jgi:hypothetical protein
VYYRKVGRTVNYYHNNYETWNYSLFNLHIFVKTDIFNTCFMHWIDTWLQTTECMHKVHILIHQYKTKQVIYIPFFSLKTWNFLMSAFPLQNFTPGNHLQNEMKHLGRRGISTLLLWRHESTTAAYIPLYTLKLLQDGRCRSQEVKRCLRALYNFTNKLIY